MASQFTISHGGMQSRRMKKGFLSKRSKGTPTPFVSTLVCFSWIFLFAAAESLHAKLESCVDILCSIADVTYLFFANDTLTWVETHHLLSSYPADLTAIILFSTHNQFSIPKCLGEKILNGFVCAGEPWHFRMMTKTESILSGLHFNRVSVREAPFLLYTGSKVCCVKLV